MGIKEKFICDVATRGRKWKVGRIIYRLNKLLIDCLRDDFYFPFVSSRENVSPSRARFSVFLFQCNYVHLHRRFTPYCTRWLNTPGDPVTFLLLSFTDFRPLAVPRFDPAPSENT